MQNSVEAAVIKELGNRVTKFRPRSLDQFEPTRESDEFGVSTRAEVVKAMLGWTLVYAEMGVVLLVLFPVVPLYASWTVFHIARQAVAWMRDPGR